MRPTPTVLITGFEPFGGQPINPSALAVRALDGRELAGRRLVAEVLPVVFGDAISALRRRLHALRPELVICVGEAGGHPHLAVERVAINVNDARIPDNAGAQPIDRAIAPMGPVGYWSTLPIKAIVAAINERGIPAAVSQTAGTFVCNHVFYGLMELLAKKPAVRGGFIHVPFLPEQAAGTGKPSLPLEQIVQGLEIAIATALTTRRDVRLVGGATH